MTPYSPTNYSMKWQNFQVHLAEEMSKLLKMESMVDVTLKAEGGTFQAHKIVLSACSPYFQKIFATIDPDYHPIIILSDICANDVRSILDFMYNGEIKVEKANITSVLKTAEDLKIEALKDIKNYLLDNPITSTENSDVELIVKTPPNNNSLPEAQTPKPKEQTKLVGLPSASLQGSLTKALIQDPGRKPTSADSTKKSLNSNDLLSASTKSLPSYPQSKSNPILSSKSNSSNRIISPVQSNSLLKIPSPIKLPVKKSIPLQETNATKSSNLLKSVPLLDSTSSKTNSLLASNSFSSLDTSWPLSLSKSIYSFDGEPLSFDNVKTKPLVEVQAPESIINDDKFNHKDASQFIVLSNFNTGSQAEQDDHVTTGITSEATNTEVHVLRYEDLEEEIMKKDEEPLSPWLILKPPLDEEDTKENIDQKNTQICVVRPDEFFMQTVDDKRQEDQTTSSASESKRQQITRVPLSKELVSQQMQDLALQKNSVTQMAQNLNVPRSTLYYRAKSSGVDIFYRKDLDAEMNQKMINATKMVKEGSTLSQACKKFGVSKTALWRRVNLELGPGALTIRSQLKSRYTQSALDKAHKELKSGVSIAKVSKKYNIPPATLHRIHNRLIDMGMLQKEKNIIPRYDKDCSKQERLLRAVNAVLESNMPITQAAIEYNIPKATLWRKVTFVNKNLPMNIVEFNAEDLEEDCDDIDEYEEDEQIYLVSHNFDEAADIDKEELMKMDECSQDQNESDYIIQEQGNDHSVFLEGNKISCGGETEEQSFLFKSDDEDEDMDSMDTPYILVTNDMCLKI